MDIFAHALWVGIGIAAASRHMPIPRGIALATVGMAVLPDLAHLLPLVAGGGGLQTLVDYALARPGTEPVLAPWVALLAHHLHCIPHSAVIAGAATLFVLRWGRWLLAPLLGWWSHIVIDVFTHSADFYPVPVLYPFTQRGFDGLAWNTPGFQVVNYSAIAVALLVLVLTRRRGT
jgi:hypothetical protein